MMFRLNGFLKQRSSVQVMVTALLLVFVVAVVDHSTGYELSLSIFYLVPIAVSTWYAGMFQGSFLSVVSAAIWLIADISAGHTYSRAFIPFWNAGVRFLFFIVTARLLTIVRAQLEKERNMARMDGLTGVMNGRAFAESAQTILRIADRFNRPTVIGYIDLDNFKRVNDSFGHAEGDRVLQSVASILLTSLRKADLVGRLGGDEFVVLLPETTGSGAAVVFKSLRDALLKKVDESAWPIGFSIGVAIFRTAPSSLNEAIKLADVLMYRVKKSGKNRILFEEFESPQETGQHEKKERTRDSRAMPPE